MRLEDFVQGRIEVPKCLDGDAYTVAGEAIASEAAREKSVYGLSFRRSPKEAPEFADFCEDDRMVLFGLTDYIRNNLTKPITTEQVDAAEEFMSTAHAFGGALNFDRTVWDKVIQDYDGFLPIKIEALPEGSTFYQNEIPVQVTSLDEGFGEVAALVEAHLVGMVSNGSARATMERHLLERMRDYAREDIPDASEEQILTSAQMMIHDFGMRASSASEESELLGKAHLLSFPGTDTFNAAYQAFVQNDDERVGSSILALAHRIVQGHGTENATFNQLREAAGPGGIGSYVADCFDFHAACEGPLLEMAIEASQTDNAIIVDRPDSGDYLENVMFVVDTAVKAGLYTEQDNGRKAMTNKRFIQGDSMNWDKISTVMDTLKENDYSPVSCGIFGIGGWLRNTPSRDTLSVAYKLMSKGTEDEATVKLSDTQAKMSVPGPVYVLRGQSPDQPSVVMQHETEFAGENALQTFYDGSIQGNEKFGEPCLEKFSDVQQRVIHEFDDSPLSRRVLSDEILGIQDRVFHEHNRSRADYKF
jgi:nicotinamide phosphoribosyltransferase